MNTILALALLLTVDHSGRLTKGGDESPQHDAAVSPQDAVPLVTVPSPEDLPNDAPVVAPPETDDAPAESAPASTTVCRCEGYKEHLCLCLKAGQKCHCSRTVGSVWAVNDQGVATHKTGDKADPRIPLNVVADMEPSDGYPVSRSGGYVSWTVDGVRWRQLDTVSLTDGTIMYHNGDARFVYRDGAMHDYGSQPQQSASKPLVNTQPAASGYWKMVCHGNWCERVWVPYR